MPPLSPPDQLLQQAVALHQAGRVADARALYQQALRLSPDHADALRLLGAAELQLGDHEESARLLARAVAVAPSQPGVRYNLGAALQALGRLEEAVASYDAAVRLRPDYADAWFNRANALLQLGRHEDAVAGYDCDLALRPGHADAHNNRGNALLALGRFEAAAASYEQAVALQPRYAGAHANRGKALTELGRLHDSAASYRTALSLDSGLAAAHADLARLYEREGLIEQALAQWEQMAERFRGAAAHETLALNEAARLLFDHLRDDAAGEALVRRSLGLDPTQREPAQDLINARQRQCAWPVVEPFAGVTRETLLRGISPLAACAYTDDPLLQLAINARRNPRRPIPADEHAAPARAPDDQRLRIGYLSSDFREHPIGQLLYEVPALHDRGRVEVHAYYSGPETADPVHAHYRAAADHFVDIRALTDEAVADRMRDDGIQILVDVNGHTLHSRKGVLARRPAPVIVNWLGFPGSTASPFHHYIVADDWIIPPEHEPYFTERVLRLPCYQPTNRRRSVAETPTRAAAGLPEDAFVFCCFNDTKKITRHTFERWLAILQRAPGSVLWLLDALGPAAANLRTHAARNDVDPARLLFAGYAPNPEHLARYRLADLFLDTTPYGAHTTCSDALWMGVPVLTWSGRSFASRVGGSLVRSAGLPELIATSAEDYVDKAASIAADPARLADYKARLVAARDNSVLFDTPGLVSRLEDLYAQMWDAHVSGALPVPDLRNLDVYLEVGIGHDHEAVEVQTLPDYRAFWRERLARRHAGSPVSPDARLWPEGP